MMFYPNKRNRFRTLVSAIILTIGLGMLFLVTKNYVQISVVDLSKQHSILGAEVKFVHDSGNIIIKLINSNERSEYTVEKFGRIIHQIQLSDSYNGNASSGEVQNGSDFKINGLGRHVEFQIEKDSENFTLIKVSTKLSSDQTDSHCVNLRTGRLHWFGGSLRKIQYWPVERNQYKEPSEDVDEEISIRARYWLNSHGGFIYVDDKVPLFVKQNVNGNNLCLKTENIFPYNVHRSSIDLIYYLGVGRDARETQRMAVKRFFKKPSALVDRRMIEHPIWSSWRRFYRAVNEMEMKIFASEIEKYGFNNSHIEIDDGWEICYGSLTFDPSKFPNIRRLTNHLKARGFRVTLWAHPFINKDCEPWYSEAKRHGCVLIGFAICII